MCQQQADPISLLQTHAPTHQRAVCVLKLMRSDSNSIQFAFLFFFYQQILSNYTNKEVAVQWGVMLSERVLSDITEKRQHLLQLPEDEGAIMLVCGVFFTMLGESVGRVTVGLAGPIIRDLLYFQENCSTSKFSSPQLLTLYGVVCVSLPVHTREN